MTEERAVSNRNTNQGYLALLLLDETEEINRTVFLDSMKRSTTIYKCIHVNLKLTRKLCRTLAVQYCQGLGSSKWPLGRYVCPEGAGTAMSPQTCSLLEHMCTCRQSAEVNN
jgi:hypothetical protein